MHTYIIVVLRKDILCEPTKYYVNVAEEKVKPKDLRKFIELFPYSALHGNTPVKNAWRMKNKSKDKWYIIYAKTLEVKKEWMDAFCQERDRVLEDHDKGMLTI